PRCRKHLQSAAAELATACSASLSVTARYLMPGSLHLPFHQRFDVNTGDRLPKPAPGDSPLQIPCLPAGRRPSRRPSRSGFEAKAGKTYWWCSCGLSHTQPLCDGHHKRINKLIDAGHYTVNYPNYRPVKLCLDEDKAVWLCQCKRTKSPPYCDGSHRNPEVQQPVYRLWHLTQPVYRVVWHVHQPVYPLRHLTQPVYRVWHLTQPVYPRVWHLTQPVYPSVCISLSQSTR
uniref:ZnF_CDGSH domain-containing protein n=1 Tax=Macrostomum lignano TaxID=282301 RepID=A0A1I8JS15_9PLAT